MSAPKEVVELVERYERNRESYQAGQYNETQARREFIDPFFKALGWDMDNEQGYAEAYKDVIHEDAIRIGSALKAPDYGFRIGGTRKFFLEAKKPSVDIKGDPAPAYQLRRYAWSARLPLSVLTDFEEFAVYDCRIKPNKDDKSSVARIMYLKYSEFVEKWDEITGKFSREAVLKGSFDKYADTAKLKKGTTQVDDAFLAEIESWRDELAHNIALRNTSLSNRELNYSVQMTIDRIIFLRICEDRGIEPYGQLQALLNGDAVYQRLQVLFRKADDRYNSGLFHFTPEKERADSPDELTPALEIDDKALKDIFRRLYYPDSPYEFSALPAEILGQVYEQFLGKVITLTAGHRAKVEDKPEVKKAGGVFYTPAYIVDYIVQNTVGKLVEGKTPKEVEKIKILDPACGSGSFLLGAYKYLLDWHLKWYLDNEPEKWAKGKRPPVCMSGAGGAKGFKLTLDERKKILLNGIFGVDIDTQAVEVTKLSLLLKVLEGEKDFSLFARERALPDLECNIKCGNSLIGPDFYQGQQATMFDDESQYKINAFDWQAEFRDIFSRKNGGFDAVIGNPPYGAELTIEQRSYLHTVYSCGNTDTAALFVEHCQSLLTRSGSLGFIIPKPFIYASNWKILRDITLPNLKILVDVSKVWREVKLEQCMVIFSKQAPEPVYSCSVRDHISFIDLGHIHKKCVDDFGFILNGVTSEEVTLASRLKNNGISLNAIATNKRGAMLQKHVSTNGNTIVLGGKQVQRWYIHPDATKNIDAAIISDGSAFIRPNSVLVQNIVAHIQNPADHIKIIATVVPDKSKDKYIILDTVNQLECNSSIHPNYLCGLLNSKLVNWYVYRFLFAKAIRTMHFDSITTNKLIVPKIDFSSEDKSPHDKLASLVQTMLELHKKLSVVKTPNEKTMLERQIVTTDGQIDALVYELYGLTEEEIKLVEESTRKK